MAICQTKVVHAQAVADNVTHLKLAVPEGCQWVTGQFARIAMPSTNEPQWRCYSIASKAGADTLDFFIARVKGGAVSPRLCNLKVGETILLDTEMNNDCRKLQNRSEARKTHSLHICIKNKPLLGASVLQARSHLYIHLSFILFYRTPISTNSFSITCCPQLHEFFPTR